MDGYKILEDNRFFCTRIIGLCVMYVEDTDSELRSSIVRDDVNVTVNCP